MLLIPTLLCACNRHQQSGSSTIPLVHKIIADASSEGHALVSGYKPEKNGGIYIVGSQDRAQAIRDELLECDKFDNVDAHRTSDGLMDFSGETICTVFDLLNTPYKKFIDEGREIDLREMTVKDVLATMDTVCYIGSYDRTGMGNKPKSKIVVLASPYLTEFGHYDVDTLFNALGCTLPVVSPLKVMINEVFDGRSKDAMVGVIAPKESISEGGYTEFVQEKAQELALTGSECVVFPSDSSQASALLGFLDKYIAAGYTKQLNAIIIDDLDVDADMMRSEFAIMQAGVNGSVETYGNLLAEDFKILDFKTSVSTECFRILRTSNQFTHNISKPAAIDFQTITPDSTNIALTKFNIAQ